MQCYRPTVRVLHPYWYHWRRASYFGLLIVLQSLLMHLLASYKGIRYFKTIRKQLFSRFKKEILTFFLSVFCEVKYIVWRKKKVKWLHCKHLITTYLTDLQSMITMQSIYCTYLIIVAILWWQRSTADTHWNSMWGRVVLLFYESR